MTESYKFKSKLTTAIGGICTIITALGVDQLEAIFPRYGKFIPAIVAFATWYSSQKTEDTRVEKAEIKAVENYQKQQNFTGYDEVMDDSTTSVVGDEDGSI
ncbi:MAG: hypothetical protein IKF11_01375 [Methanobrevibacter sp.]|nr:hypothetical protein [Methanobrevibacter sp.]